MPNSQQLLTRLRAEIDALPVIDIHTHLRPSHPNGHDLAEVLLYHHLGTELMSAGMPPEAVSTSGLPHEVADPGIEPLERVKAALPYLPRIRNTTVGGFLRTILTDLYCLSDKSDPSDCQLTTDNLEAAWAAAAQRAADPAWPDYVLRERCNIVHSVTVERTATDLGRRFLFISEGCNGFFLADKAMNRQRAFENVERSAGQAIHDAESLRAAVENTVHRQLDRNALALTFWMPADMFWREADDGQLTEALAHLRAGHATNCDRDVFATHAMRHALRTMRDAGLHRAQIFLGAEVKLPHRSVSVASGQFARELAQIFNQFEDLHFELLAAAEIHTQDTCILAKHFPNVRVAGYWWHTLYPSSVRKIIESRFDIVPENKITAFFSDAYTAEWCYPKVRMVKRILAEVLAAKVESGDYTEGYAVELARRVLYDNPREFYELPDAGSATTPP